MTTGRWAPTGLWHDVLTGEPRWIDEPRPAPAPNDAPEPEVEHEAAPNDAPDADGEPWVPPDTFEPQPIVAFAADALGLPLWPAQAALLSELYRDEVRVALWRLGRRSGKDRMASVVATLEATVNADLHLAHVPPGEQVAVVVVANSRKQAAIVHRFCRGYLRRQGLANLIVRDTDDEIELSTGMVIATLPCTARSTRGYAVAVVIFDEAAWYSDVDGSPIGGDELWDALVPGTAQFPAGRVLVLSTPRWGVGWFADMCRKAASGRLTGWRHWWAPTATMNPIDSGLPGSIRSDFLQNERESDPAAFAREYEAKFASGVGAVFAEDSVRAAAVNASKVPRLAGRRYLVSIDPAYLDDTFAVLVGHREGQAIDVDFVTGWTARPGAPVSHREALDGVAAVAREYGDATVLTDQYGSEPLMEGFAERGIRVQRRPWTADLKADAASTARQLFHQRLLRIPAHRQLISELVTLESSPLPSGRVRIAAPAGRDVHDDYAIGLLALVHELALPSGYQGPAESFSLVA